MTIEDLKKHCIKTIKMSEAIESIPNVKITDNRSLQEHKMILKLIEAWEKVDEEIKVIRDRECLENDSFDEYSEGRYDVACECLRIIDKHLSEVSE